MIFDLIFGFLLLFAGRNFFWLCVGTVGFLIGMQCAGSLGFSNEWTAFGVALVLGILGSVLTVCFEWGAVVFGVGFLGGGYLLMNILPLAAQQDSLSWLIFVVGGVLGMCLMIITFDLTLIMISSLLGATLIVNAFYGTAVFRAVLFIMGTATGIVVQYLALNGTVKQKRSTNA